MKTKAGLPLLALAGLAMLAFTSGSTPAVAASDACQIPLGGQKILKLDRAVGRIALSNPKVVDVKVVNSRQLRLLGQGAGSTDLTVWYEGDASTSYRCVVGADIAGLESALDADPALKSVKVSNTGKSTVLKGQVYSLADRARVGDLAVSYVGKDVRNLVEVSEQRMVAVDIRFAAVSVNTLKALGLNFRTLGGNFEFASTGPSSGATPGYVNGQGLDLAPTLPIAQAFNLMLSWPGSNNFLGVVSALSSANLAQMLAEPTLLVRSGEEADFLAGGEIPIPVPQSGVGTGSVTIEYKKFGVQLNVAATVLDNDRIILKVNPEVSELDPANGISVQGYSIPAIRTRSTRTTVELGDGQSFVLAGLMFSSSSNLEDKVPGLGDLPIIGNFFKTSMNKQEQQELIIVATPRLVSPMEAGTVPKLPGEGQKYDPGVGQMLLNTEQLDQKVVQYGLMR
ncbi:MAG TPA: pilus assembly protein N-terminal domain-containing protein [Parvibaculum sp.]|jgi:pilus assembly protein CpaC